MPRTPPPPTKILRLDESKKWLQEHASAYPGQWVAVRYGALLGTAATVRALLEEIGGPDEATPETIIVQVLNTQKEEPVMPHTPPVTAAGMPDIRYVCTRQELETLLQATCATVLEVLDTTVHEPQEQIMRREIIAALDDWCHRAIMLVPQPKRRS